MKDLGSERLLSFISNFRLMDPVANDVDGCAAVAATAVAAARGFVVWGLQSLGDADHDQTGGGSREWAINSDPATDDRGRKW